MPRDNRKILNGVRIDDTVYKTDMEDELATAASSTQIEHLLNVGAIEGDWGVEEQENTDKAASSSDVVFTGNISPDATLPSSARTRGR